MSKSKTPIELLQIDISVRSAARLMIGRSETEGLTINEFDEVGRLSAMIMNATKNNLIAVTTSHISDDENTKISIESLVTFLRSRGYPATFTSIDTREPTHNSIDTSLEPNETSAQPIKERKERRGRKSYDWDSFYVELAGEIHCNGLPEKQSILENKMLQWCSEDWQKEPAVSTVREKISPVWERIKNGLD